MAKKDKIKIGLDVGSYSIKYAKLSLDKDGKYKLVKYGLYPVNKNAGGKLVDTLSLAVKEMGEKNVNVAVSGPSVVVRYIQLPKMKKEELNTSIQFEAEKYIPFNINDVILDHHILDPNIAGKTKILLVAAKKDMINGRIDLLQKAGLNINLIDADSFALINAFIFTMADQKSEKIMAVINIGEKQTNVNIILKELPYFTRDFQMGGGDITKAISEKMNIDIAAAQKLKENPESKLTEVSEITKPILSSLADEIRLSLSYYENQFGNSVDEVYISGGAHKQQGFIESLNTNLGLTCQLWDPIKAFSTDIKKEELEKVKHELPVAIGLALRD